MTMQTDLVCGMQVDDQSVPAKSQYQGTNYYFCSSKCKRKFDQQPEQYENRQPHSTQEAQRGDSNR